MLGGRRGGQGPMYAFEKMSFMVHCDFQKGSQNQHFLSTLLVGREVERKGGGYNCTLELTILDDPLDVNEIAGSGLKLGNILDEQFAQVKVQIHYSWAKIKHHLQCSAQD